MKRGLSAALLQLAQRGVGRLARRSLGRARRQRRRRRRRTRAPGRTGARARTTRRTRTCGSPPAQPLGEQAADAPARSARSGGRHARRIQPGHHRRVRRQRLRHGRIRLPEAAAARGNRVERRGLDAGGLRTDRVGARGVERDQQDRVTAARLAARSVSQARDRTPGQNDTSAHRAARPAPHLRPLRNCRARW